VVHGRRRGELCEQRASTFTGDAGHDPDPARRETTGDLVERLDASAGRAGRSRIVESPQQLSRVHHTGMLHTATDTSLNDPTVT
jgi:hypothetical protein